MYTTPGNALTFTKTTVPNSKCQAYQITANNGVFGRVQLTINYANGIVQTVHHFVTASQLATGEKYADQSFTNSYFNDTSDQFHRYGLVTYDQIANAQVLQDDRAWIAGEADKAGSQYEGICMKESAHPNKEHIFQLEQMVNHSIWSNLQNFDYSVKRSLFFYEPSAVPGYPYSTRISWGGTWNKNDAYSTWRAEDYVHASAIYYALYRASRVSLGILKLQTPMWYWNQAFHTVVASQNHIVYADVGLMGETMWVKLLEDLFAEGLSSEAAQVTQTMKGRQALWATQSGPFGSEMQRHSTAEEGVYAWSRYFKDQATMTKSLDYIRGYTPTVAHWGWNGSARHYWDFLYGGKLPRVERMIYHYGSSLNALPPLDNYEYQSSPASPAAF
ncbi:uncharacterized protein CLAFUR5_04070 [Fulvia fulva]|uniref:Uncharacterized protein n=1 Tax=Passalora fulva TaxID=5499 RepID=A0A9Q8P850_PASFU|nr:uncharacterized protein CLAFUR5_04070 [Fulvia fulva]KAK4627808.1 hypothetical protein CLAFUR0_04095 [Fulvia fulva]UJO16726.1 hypothetical protein CLAFUR5_04070 [Fulvia fulva]